MVRYSVERDLLRYSRQIVLKAMDRVRTRMRGSARLAMKETVENLDTDKSTENLTKAIDKEAEDLMLAATRKKFVTSPVVLTTRWPSRVWRSKS